MKRIIGILAILLVVASCTRPRDNPLDIQPTTTTTVVGTTYIINAVAGTGGSISSSGNTTVNSGSSKTYLIIANSGYQIDKILVDGIAMSVPIDTVSNTSSSHITFSNITANHTISVTFKV